MAYTRYHGIVRVALTVKGLIGDVGEPERQLFGMRANVLPLIGKTGEGWLLGTGQHGNQDDNGNDNENTGQEDK